MKKVIITGILGQDGSYLSELLLEKGYEVHGIERRIALEVPSQHHSRIKNIEDKLYIHYGDVSNYETLLQLVSEIKPDEIYHLAAQSQVNISFKDEWTIFNNNIKSTINVLNAIRFIKPDCKFYHAGSSEQFGKVLEIPQTETTSFNPRSPYAIGKLHSFFYTKMYRDAYNIFACNGILFNHESERRAEEFVTRKITKVAARIKLGKQKELLLGNLDAQRDWGYTPDYVRAMYLMLQHHKPDDYVIATGETHSIREFLDVVFSYLKLDWHEYVKIDKKFLRPADVNILVGDTSKAKRVLGWEPKVKFKELAIKMAEHDLKGETDAK